MQLSGMESLVKWNMHLSTKGNQDQILNKKKSTGRPKQTVPFNGRMGS